jgi:maleylpyruvate isomerase
VDTEIALALARLGGSTDRLLATADTLTDAQAAAASRLPGWTRGHVLTHLARNADGFRNLLAWARTGAETPMYPSEAARDQAIEAGAGRSAAELAADLRESAAALAAAARALPAGAWDAPVARRGETFPARGILPRRRSELEIHHVDLGAGYQPGDWPPDFVQVVLARVAGDFAGRADAPACLARPDGLNAAYPIGPAGPDSPSPDAASPDAASPDAASAGPGRAGPGRQVIVSGPPAALLAWLIGRDSGAGLGVAGAGAVPVLPPWR